MENSKLQKLKKQIGLVLPELQNSLSKGTDEIILHGISIPRSHGQEMLTELQKITLAQSFSNFQLEIIPLPLLIVSDEWRMIQVIMNEAG